MKNAKEKIIKIADIVTISTAIIISVIAFIIDGYNSYVDNNTKIDYAFVATTLLLAIAIHFILVGFFENEMSNQQKKLTDALEQSVSTIINSLNGVEVIFFEDINKVDMYIAERILTATECVYDFNWQDYIPINPYHRNISDKEFAANKIDLSIKSFCSKKAAKPRIYREIFTFSYPRNIGKMLTHITYGDAYCCSYYDNKRPNTKFPKLQFVVIDDKEVIFVSSAYKPNLCSIKNIRIASIFCNYFEQAWELSKIIKDRDKINNNVINDIKEKYGNECNEDAAQSGNNAIKKSVRSDVKT